MATITVAQETTWKEIQEAVDRGEADKFKIGQIITDTMKDGREIPFVVVETSPDGIIFVNKKSFGDHCMNKNGLNKGGWNGSDMRKYLNEEVYALLPDELQKVIASRTVIEKDSDGDEVVSLDKLWCLSEMELFGENYNCSCSEGEKQFPYFEKRINRIFEDADGNPDYAWERSPYVTGSNYFVVVGASGYPYNHYAINRFGVVFGFCIKRSRIRIINPPLMGGFRRETKMRYFKNEEDAHRVRAITELSACRTRHIRRERRIRSISSRVYQCCSGFRRAGIGGKEE